MDCFAAKPDTMNHCRPALPLLLLLAVLTPVTALAVGDPEAGEQKAVVCSACHGSDGNSLVSVWPKIAGQHVDYAARQTRMIRDRVRDVPQMYPMVMGLSDQDIEDISAYYATRQMSPGVADEDLVELGRLIYQGGDHEREIPACMACHGPAGGGIPGAHFPLLRGQHADYSADRLRRYRNGELNGDNDPHSRSMAEIAARLTDQEIDALGSYIEGLHRAQ